MGSSSDCEQRRSTMSRRRSGKQSAYLPLIFAFFPNWNQDLQDDYGGATVFTLTTHLEPGFWLLAIAAILSTGIGQVTLNKCSRSLFDANHEPLSNSIAASFSNTEPSTVTAP